MIYYNLPGLGVAEPFMATRRVSINEDSYNINEFVESVEPNIFIDSPRIPSSLPTVAFEFGPIKRAIDELNILLNARPRIITNVNLTPRLAYSVVAPSRLRIAIERDIDISATFFLTPITLDEEITPLELTTPNIPIEKTITFNPDFLATWATRIEVEVDFQTRVMGGLEGTIVASLEKMRGSLRLEGIMNELQPLWDVNQKVYGKIELFGEWVKLVIEVYVRLKPNIEVEDYRGNVTLSGQGAVTLRFEEL